MGGWQDVGVSTAPCHAAEFCVSSSGTNTRAYSNTPKEHVKSRQAAVQSPPPRPDTQVFQVWLSTEGLW